MPRFDGTGPNGAGPKTGKKFGNCETEKNTKEVKNIINKPNLVRGLRIRRGQNR